MNIFKHLDVDFAYLVNQAGDDIKINDSNTYVKALINNHKVNKAADIKSIACLSELKRGDYITWDSEKWLILSEIGHKRFNYYKGIIQKCNSDIIFNFNGVIKSIPAIIDSKQFDINTGQYILLPTGKVLLMVQENLDTRDIILNMRFVFERQVFKVCGKDFTDRGLIIFTCDLDAISSNDDLENSIADRFLYSFIITNTNFSIQEGQSIQVTTEFKSGSNIISDYEVVYSVDNESIAIISSTGLLTGVSAGDVNVSVWLKDSPYYKDNKTFTIQAKPQMPVYEILPTSGEILDGNTVNYTCNKYVAGVLTPTTWSIENLTGMAVPSSGYYTFTVTGANTFSVKNLKMYYSGKVKIRCKDIENIDTTSNYVDILITLKGAW